jgi:hypothetical protein
MRPVIGFLTMMLTVVGAVAIGFGVPLLWVWIGSQLQGGSGATTLNFSVAMAILAGIIATYVAVLYIAGMLISRFDRTPEPEKQKSTAREPWLRGMSDTRAVRPARKSTATESIERVFIITTLLVTMAAWIWFLFFAEGGGLPNP